MTAYFPVGFWTWISTLHLVCAFVRALSIATDDRLQQI